jgi:phenylalanyl-tRNA synthetase beta chain
VRLFEIGRVFLGDERDTLAGLVFNGTDPRTPWPETLDDFLSVKADVLALLGVQGIEPAFEQGSEPFGRAGQTGRVPGMGYLARLSPAIERELGFPGPVYVFEFDLSALGRAEKPVYAPASPFPASFRDVSLLVPIGRTQEKVAAEIRAAVEDVEKQGAKILENVKLFDVYDGKGIPEGYCSMAFSLCYRAADRTLNDEEVDKIHNAARDALTQKGYNIR